MKKNVIFISIIIAVLSDKLDDERKELKKIHEECQSDPDTYADEELLKNLEDNFDNPQVQAHMLCESTKVEFQDGDDLYTDVIREKIELSVKNDDRKVTFLVDQCATHYHTPGETAVYVFLCLDFNNVTYFQQF